MTNREPRTITRLGSLLEAQAPQPARQAMHCPVCGGEVQQQKCKVLCRSEKCVYRIIYNCSEF